MDTRLKITGLDTQTLSGTYRMPCRPTCVMTDDLLPRCWMHHLREQNRVRKPQYCFISVYFLCHTAFAFITLETKSIPVIRGFRNDETDVVALLG